MLDLAGDPDRQRQDRAPGTDRDDGGPAREPARRRRTWSGKLRTARIRVYADTSYRAQNLRWKHAFDQQLAAANCVLGAKLGITLEPEYVEWDRQVAGSRLEDDGRALAELDRGDDVFAVVGLTSSITLVSATFEELSIAEVGGRHIVVRGYAGVEERKAFEHSFPNLEQTERDSTLQGRRDHKLAVVLGHSLGMDHDAEPDTIMNASYSRLATAFSQCRR